MKPHVTANLMSGRPAKKTATGKKSPRTPLLTGGNPQIAKADGEAPVESYIAAMPGWKRDVGRRLDALVGRTVPGVRKAVKWNSPLYGVEGRGWFLGIHCYTKYVKLAFFRGAALRPPPPGESRDRDTRYLDIREHDRLDEEQFTAWVRQAAALPGWVPGSDLRRRSPTVQEAPNSASTTIDRRVRDLGDWHGSVLQRIRDLIHEADPAAVEEWKWKKASSPGTPVWSHDGGICTGESYRQVVKLTFFHGASLNDRAHLFNASLGGNTRRAIDIREGDAIDEAAFKELIRAAVAFNLAKRNR